MTPCPPQSDPGRKITTGENLWHSIDTAPRDGTPIRVMYEWDGCSVEDGVYFAATRQCMLGARAGECGPGFVSAEAGNLPVEPTHWMPLPAAPIETTPPATTPLLPAGDTLGGGASCSAPGFVGGK